MPDEPNILEPAWDAELDAPFALKASRVAAHAGARELGATLFEVAPGGAISPYHLHHGNEELLIVLDGRPSLRTPEGTRELAAGAVVAFPRGADGAHQVRNDGGEPVRVLLVSTMNFPDLGEHVDTGTTLAIEGPRAGKSFPKGADIPIWEALGRAMA
jgi:uncharacterized cupin superfamily protein